MLFKFLEPPLTTFSDVFLPFDFLPQGEMLYILPFELSRSAYGRVGNKISLDRYDEFIGWIVQHLEQPASKEEVKAEYDKIIEYFNNVLMQDSQRWQKAIAKGKETH